MDPPVADAMQDSRYIVVPEWTFYFNLVTLVVNAIRHHWVEAPYYGMLNYIFTMYCATITVVGAGFSSHPQTTFTNFFDPDRVSPRVRSHQSPDFGTIRTFLPGPGDPPAEDGRPMAKTPPQLAFFWEVKPSHTQKWADAIQKREAEKRTLTHFRQLSEQARHAFAHYGGQQHFAFLSDAFFFTFVEFINPEADDLRSGSDDDESSGPWFKPRHLVPGASPLSVPAKGGKRARVQPTGPVQAPYPRANVFLFCEPMFVGEWLNVRLNPLLLTALRMATNTDPDTVQPSFLQASADYVFPSELAVYANRRIDVLLQDEQWRMEADIKKAMESSSSPPEKAKRQKHDNSENLYQGFLPRAGPSRSPITTRSRSRASSLAADDVDVVAELPVVDSDELLAHDDNEGSPTFDIKEDDYMQSIDIEDVGRDALDPQPSGSTRTPQRGPRPAAPPAWNNLPRHRYDIPGPPSSPLADAADRKGKGKAVAPPHRPDDHT